MKRLKLVLACAVALVLFASAPLNASAPERRRKAAAVIREAAEQTRDEGTAQVEMSIDIESEAFNGELMSMEGVIELGATGNGQLLMTMGDGVFGTPLDIEMRMIDNVAYMDFSSFFSVIDDEELPEEFVGRPWIVMDLSDLAASAETVPGSSNPAGQLEALRGLAKGSVDTVGEEEIDGVTTTRYRAVLDLTKAAEEVPEEFRSQFDQSLQLLGGELPDVPVNVWIDGQGRVRQMRMDFEIFAEGESLAMAMTMKFHDFGTPVEVEPPPTEETIPYETFLELTGAA